MTRRQWPVAADDSGNRRALPPQVIKIYQSNLYIELMDLKLPADEPRRMMPTDEKGRDATVREARTRRHCACLLMLREAR